MFKVLTLTEMSFVPEKIAAALDVAFPASHGSLLITDTVPLSLIAKLWSAKSPYLGSSTFYDRLSLAASIQRKLTSKYGSVRFIVLFSGIS